MQFTSSHKLLGLLALGLGLTPIVGRGLINPTLALTPAIPTPTVPTPAVPTPLPQTLAPPILPPDRADQVRDAMAAALNRDRAAITIVPMDTRFTTWKDCALPQTRECRPTVQQGWRVTLRGKNPAGRRETWQYLFNQHDQRLTLDGPASLSPVVRRAIAKQANLPVNDLKIRAAQLIQVIPSCPPGALCKVLPIPAWRVLLDGAESPYTVDLQGQKITEDLRRLLPKDLVPKDLAGMPTLYGQQVIDDVRDRSGGQLPKDFTVASVRAVEWNACTGAGDTRPSIMPMGACPNFTQRAWQVVTQGGPVKWVYYLPRPEVIPSDPIGKAVPLVPLDSVRPDGLQSLPKAVSDRLPQRSGVTRRLFWADAGFFDGCLNPANSLTPMPVKNGFTDALTCRTIVQSGWRVTLHEDGPVRSGMGTPALYYHTTQDGRSYRLINETQWFPPPVAPPMG